MPYRTEVQSLIL